MDAQSESIPLSRIVMIGSSNRSLERDDTGRPVAVTHTREKYEAGVLVSLTVERYPIEPSLTYPNARTHVVDGIEYVNDDDAAELTREAAVKYSGLLERLAAV